MNGTTKRSSTGRVRSALLSLLVLAAAVLATPAVAFAANAYGQTFAGQQTCLECHGATTGRWQVGTYPQTAHGRFVNDVQAATSTLVPGPTLWPSPSLATGLRFDASEIWLMLGAPGKLHEYVTVFKNDTSHLLKSGQTLNTITGPADDYLMVSGSEWSPSLSAWEMTKPTVGAWYFQGCGGCHFLGVTRPTETTVTLASGATVGHSTETSYSGFGIQCENCHGTGKAGTSHWTSGVDIVRTKRVLKSQTCGQCHVNGTAKEKNYIGKTYSGPNGFTTDRNLEDFYDLAAIQYVKTSRSMTAPSIPTTDTKVYPNGSNKKMHHSYYNEWMLTPHARSLKYKNGDLWSTHAQDRCLPCHSGEGFLKSIGYGASDPNDIALGGSSIASDTLNIECAVCHTVHATNGDALGLRMEGEELCSKCHNAAGAPGEELAPGTNVHHPQAEMRNGYGLIGVERPAKRFMGETGCPKCHMPVTYEDRVSHSFKVMTPGDAKAWGVQTGGDSCTPCHTSKSRDELQADLDEWEDGIAQAMDAAKGAVADARSRAASTTADGIDLLGSASTNISYVTSDKSNGAHNYPYAKAGLEKAEYFAKSVGGGFSRFGMTGYDKTMQLAVAFGTLRFGDLAPAAGEVVSLQAKPAGTDSWFTVGSTIVGADGDFSYAVTPTGTTSYRAVWSPKDDVSMYSGLGTVTMGTTTTLKSSKASMRLGYSTVLTGAVSPNHASQRAVIRYKLGSPGTWRTLSTRVLSGTSTYSFTWKPSARGTYYLQTSFAGDVSHTGSKSSTVALRVY